MNPAARTHFEHPADWVQHVGANDIRSADLVRLGVA